MLATILGFVTSGKFLGGLGMVILGFILKKIKNETIRNPVKTFFKGIGITITVFFGAKFKWTKLFWNKLIEPYLIDLLDNVVGGAVEGLIEGLKSDNK